MHDTPTPIETELLVATCTPEGRFVYRNQAWRAVLGAEAEPWSRLPEADRPLAARHLEQAASGSLVTNELFLVDIPNRGNALPVLLHFLPFLQGDSGKATEVHGVTVTGEVLAQPSSWTMSQTQRHRMETLGRMTMGIAHDFNNLLSGILGYTELVKTLLAASESPQAAFKEHMRTIEQAALDGAALIGKIQQFIRQEKQTLFESLDLPTLIKDCISLTRPYWYNEPRRQGIAIEVEMDLTPVPRILGSATELREVFVNLILNAVQAMPEGGTLTFTTALDRQTGVRLTLADTGTGMSERVRQRIFEPLFTTKGEQGTGMGLAVSYGIVQEHEGAITVESTPGRGTRFILTFPPAEPDEATSLEEKAAIARKQAHILVVDDEEMVRSVLSKLLSLKGHTVELAASGAEALALVAQTSYDLVFTDHGMPGMSGRELARTLRTHYPDLPIVLLTGDTEVGDAVDDVSTVVAKPFKIDQLEAVIQGLL